MIAYPESEFGQGPMAIMRDVEKFHEYDHAYAECLKAFGRLASALK